ncbi:hypothetical protein Q0F99_20205 [Rathayibacter oskolensis]|uniref:hypothetical protein n=1 Tax=Rathayibacter oskolensis TaxID=1891671 RepID=UPI0026605A58|nr:hypothetical protein [Rathayibacter oskolensis]WKK71604.1 hypothetical protein Q0F99_20205 [Rathayibacter oskolensis]
MKVAHHGSSDQSPALYDALGARIGLISVGAGNDYGHPNPALLALLAERGTEALRTDLDGTVVLSSRRDGVAVWSSGASVSATAERLAPVSASAVAARWVSGRGRSWARARSIRRGGVRRPGGSPVSGVGGRGYGRRASRP